MSRSLLVLLAAMSVAASLSAAHAAEIPGCGPASATPNTSVTVFAGRQCYSFGSQIVSGEGKLRFLPTLTQDLGQGASFSIGAIFDPDPFAAFTFGSILPTGFGPLTFEVYFTTPVIGGPYNAAMSAATLDVTASGRETTGLVTAGLSPFYLSGSADGTDLGVGTGTGDCTASTPPDPFTISCDPSGASNMFAPFTPPFLTAHLSYTHDTTGTGQSTVSWTGIVELFSATTTTVPEPSTGSLLLAGIAMAGIWRMRVRTARMAAKASRTD